MSTFAIPMTVSIPLYGRLVLEIGENSAYAAAERGEIPVIKVGGKKRVPVRAALRELAGGDQVTLDKLVADFARKLEEQTEKAA